MNTTELKRFPVLEELTGEERELLAGELETIELQEGRVAFEEGSDADGLVLVAEGELRLESREHGELGRFGPGAALGGIGLVAPGRREASAVATQACRVLWLGRSDYRRLALDCPPLACKLLEAVIVDFAGAVREGLPRLRSAG